MEKMGRMTAEDNMLMDFERRRMKEALRRLEKLTEDFDLDGDILNRFKEGTLSYCFLIPLDGTLSDCFSIPADGMPFYVVGANCINQEWREKIEKFERRYNVLVYLALADKTPRGVVFFSMLYVSSCEEDWEYEGPMEAMGDCVAAYVYNSDMGEGEFGDIFLTSNRGALIRKA